MRRDGQYGLLTTVASEAGVSLSTVSKVVHRRPDVGAATRARVEELLARCGYVRPGERDPAVASQIIAVFRDLSGPYTLEVVRGIVDAADELSLDVVTGTFITLVIGVSAAVVTATERGSSGRTVKSSTDTVRFWAMQEPTNDVQPLVGHPPGRRVLRAGAHPAGQRRYAGNVSPPCPGPHTDGDAAAALPHRLRRCLRGPAGRGGP